MLIIHYYWSALPYLCFTFLTVPSTDLKMCRPDWTKAKGHENCCLSICCWTCKSLEGKLSCVPLTLATSQCDAIPDAFGVHIDTCQFRMRLRYLTAFAFLTQCAICVLFDNYNFTRKPNIKKKKQWCSGSKTDEPFE